MTDGVPKLCNRPCPLIVLTQTVHNQTHCRSDSVDTASATYRATACPPRHSHALATRAARSLRPRGSRLSLLRRRRKPRAATSSVQRGTPQPPARLPSPRAVAPIIYAHHGARSVRKSVSVHGVSVTTSSSMEMCASASESGAGPRMTLPWLLYCDPWHGHLNLFSAGTHGTTQPRCVQTALRPNDSMVESWVTMRYVGSPCIWPGRIIPRGAQRDWLPTGASVVLDNLRGMLIRQRGLAVGLRTDYKTIRLRDERAKALEHLRCLRSRTRARSSSIEAAWGRAGWLEVPEQSSVSTQATLHSAHVSRLMLLLLAWPRRARRRTSRRYGAP